MSPGRGAELAVFVVAGDRAVAIPIHEAIESMRPLPVEPMAGLPAWVEGLALIRGRPTPVLNLAALLGEPDAGSTGAFVTVRAKRQPVALAVRRVAGVGPLAPGEWQTLPSIAAGAPAAVEAVGVIDSQLATMLNAGRLVSDEVWARLEAEFGGREWAR